LDGVDLLDVMNILVAAESLNLQEIVNYLQSYLIKEKTKWMEENFSLIHDTIFQSNNFIELQKYCTDLMSKNPEKIFKSLDFISISEKSLISLIKRDDLRMKEADVWENVLKWGLGKNPALITDPESWSDDDFKTMENTLQRCLPLIRFFQFSSKEFLKNVTPYQKLLNPQLYKDLLKYYLDEDHSNIISTIQPARGGGLDNYSNLKDSKLITNGIAAAIANWIDIKEIKLPITQYNTLDNPYEFKLLLRGSRDGFDAETFHKLCDNKPKTVTIVKVEGTKEILGGYNPIIWESTGKNKFSSTDKSFLFSFSDINLKDVILSRIKNYNYAILSSSKYCPCFSSDLILRTNSSGKCYYEDYEFSIRFTKKDFSIEEYEVFQIVKKVD